jgi:peptidyl-dipeptidase Dcp
MVTLDDIRIRTELLPGDLGYVLYLHGSIYGKENDYGRPFEVYVAEGLLEFARRYDSSMDRVWVCEHDGVIMGFMLLMHRENNEAQLRYFLIHPDYRGIGLGKKLMELFRQFASQCNYGGVYLWTTNEQKTAISLYLRYGFRLTEEKASTTFGKTTIEQRYDLILR